MVISSKEQQGATSALRWADIVDEEEERVSSPPTHNKLSPEAPIFVPRSAKSVMPGQGFPSADVTAILGDHLVSFDVEKFTFLTPINTKKQLQVGGSSHFSPNRFDNLRDEDIFEEGEEEDVLDHRFANAIRNADISPRQQCNNKKKHERRLVGMVR
ncbi:hypothetical protein H5410_045247 [Solanum commersonii]|uniref:Uncharacterized protein n=1 Tax=Solanum commersonii TaxID=4109 RepID=A0A9J5XB42_SOLCO|nr:hypothetical protein H5410_045247 [Solanum commersonii]